MILKNQDLFRLLSMNFPGETAGNQDILLINDKN
jgi:hypothetical protein